jgi:hypothetical protein
MAIVSISEASRLTSRSRASLYRAFKSGELSKSELPDGSPGVDTGVRGATEQPTDLSLIWAPERS